MLAVLLHGVGADASQVQALAERWGILLPEVAFLAPDGPLPFDAGPPGRQWFSLADRSPAVLQAGAERASLVLNAAIDAECTRLGLAPDAVAIAGFSQGAMMALHAGLRRRPAPACIVAYAGAMLPVPPGALSGRPAVLLVHGESDEVVPFTHGPQAAAILRSMGIPTDTLWRPGLAHSVDEAGILAGAGVLKEALTHRPA